MQRLQSKIQRTAYLHALGIDSWEPRQRAGNVESGSESPASRLLDDISLEVANDADVPASVAVRPDQGENSSQQTAAPSAKVLVNRGLAMAEIMDIDQAPSPGGNIEPVSVAKAAVTDSQSGLTTHPNVHFELQGTVVQDLLFIDEVTGLKLAPSAYLNWLHALIASLGRGEGLENAARDTGGSLDMDKFTWPLPAGGLFDSGDSAVAETLQAWVQRKLETHPVQWVVLMGNAPVSYLANSENPAAQLGSIARYEGSVQVNALLTLGTAQLWQEPLRKRELWEHFQALLL